MSGPTIEEKLSQPRSTSGKARRTLKSLSNAWGYVALRMGSPPPLVSISLMEKTTKWRHVSGRGPDAVYEEAEE